MPLQIIGDVATNVVKINKTFLAEASGTIEINGSGNTVIIDTARKSNYISVRLHGNDHFLMGQNSFVNILEVYLLGGSTCSIGENTFGIGKVKLYSHEKGIIAIGRDCLMGDELQCMTSDMHSILDVGSGKRINPPGNIMISDKVWLGFDVTILKGTVIGSGSIVGARSTVMGEFPENCAVLGFPARLVKSGVTWAGDLLPV
jgi:acetyltransferase-like isoleucine patch superfamily enzyme